MTLDLQTPILYQITSGQATSNADFPQILKLVEAACDGGLQLIQLREKNLTARLLYELTLRAAEITRDSTTRLLVNDRSDIARAARADGVHLTTLSLDARITRRTFGDDFLIGVSTHSLAEACAARDKGADFAVFGPVFDTPSKREYGPSLGLEKLSEVADTLSPFPLLAIGGITRDNVPQTLHAGARGIAAITLFSDAQTLKETARTLYDAARFVIKTERSPLV